MFCWSSSKAATSPLFLLCFASEILIMMMIDFLVARYDQFSLRRFLCLLLLLSRRPWWIEIADPAVVLRLRPPFPCFLPLPPPASQVKTCFSRPLPASPSFCSAFSEPVRLWECFQPWEGPAMELVIFRTDRRSSSFFSSTFDTPWLRLAPSPFPP